MPKLRGPDDRKPPDAPAYPEVGGTRWELPVTIAGATGVLMIRCFDNGRDDAMFLAGRAVLLLDAERRNRR